VGLIYKATPNIAASDSKPIKT